MSDSLKRSKTKTRAIENLSARVYNQIKNLILCNEIMPGQKLHHQQLSERLGVSRTPVREALTRLVEAFAVEKAIANLTDAALARLRAKMNSYGRDVQNRFTRERLVFDQDVHLAIAELSGNETLMSTLNHVFERIVLKRRTDGLYDPARGLAAHQEHLRVLEAIERRDPDEAVAILRSHIQAGKKNVMADLQQRQAMRGLRVIEADK